MIINYVIFGLDVPNWIFLVIGVMAVIAIIVFICRSIMEQEETREAVRKEKEIEKLKKEQEKGYHSTGSSLYSEKTFLSALSHKLKVTWKVHEKATTDILTISSSWPIEMDGIDLENFQKILPEVISIKAIGKHQLSFKKSPAAEFDSIKEVVLQRIFYHLNKKYAWAGKETTITFTIIGEELLCRLEYRLVDHLAIGILLESIDEIQNIEGIKQQMIMYKNEFSIIKKDEKTWDELIPLIKSVFVDYFPKDVEFTGDYPSVEKKSSSTKKEEDIDESNWTDAG